MSDEKLEELARAAAEVTKGGEWTRERDWVEAIDSHAFVRPYPAVGRYILAANPAAVLELVRRLRVAEAKAAIADAAIRFYDGLDVDGLLPEYFGSGSDGNQYRGLRDAVRAFRKRSE
jgi:hypothetical protein